MTLSVRTRVERWPIAGKFVISRGSRTEATVVVVEVTDGEHRGRGECVPYPRYGETVDSVLAEIAAVQLDGLEREALRRTLHPGAARNALDCALWTSKQRGPAAPPGSWRALTPCGPSKPPTR
jgi:L-alanine-DL-glutamate epimerase-like enolase superfamily enzyme